MNMYTKLGNPSVNNCVESVNGGRMFISYNTNIAYIIGNNVFLDREYWNYSKTTTYYRNQFLGENTAVTRKKIESGEYTLIDLNKD